MRASHLTGELKLIADQVGAWAALQPDLARLWLFGSHAGNARLGGSDIDIAYEPGQPMDEVTGVRWAAEVSAALGLDVRFQAILDAAVQDAVTDHGILIYERSGAPPSQWLTR